MKQWLGAVVVVNWLLSCSISCKQSAPIERATVHVHRGSTKQFCTLPIQLPNFPVDWIFDYVYIYICSSGICERITPVWKSCILNFLLCVY